MPVTPLRRQYLQIKKQYPNVIVFFRLGDFYETFDEDARITARELEITLTAREMGKGKRVPLAGIPYHAVNNYLGKLINKGYKVAICEQMSPPGKGLVEREVVRVVTPGTVLETGILNEKSNNYLASLIRDGTQVGLAYIDVTTGEFAATQIEDYEVANELERIQPAELLLPEAFNAGKPGLPKAISKLDDYYFDHEIASQVLIEHFGVLSLDAYGCANLPLAVRAAGAVLYYVRENQKTVIGQINHLSTYTTKAFMTLDIQTRRNLEIYTSSRWGVSAGSLLAVLDHTRTAMGGRLLKRWVGQPLLNVDNLIERQNAVQWLYDNTMARQTIISVLHDVSDLERIINRINTGIALPRELIALKRSLECIPQVLSILDEYQAYEKLKGDLKPCPDVVMLVQSAIADDPGNNLSQGNVIKSGFSEELDSIKQAAYNARNYIANLEQQEKERTGIKSLKVGYNRVFGYYIEVSKSNLGMVPDVYIRKQTLVNAERYITSELKEYESLILNAQEKIQEIESGLFKQVCSQIAQMTDDIMRSAQALAELDVFSSFADVAVNYTYKRPVLNNGNTITIKGGRHPVVENSMGRDQFIANDTYLCNDDDQLIILTGPNMSGKSTYLRQVALIVLLAQIGSFIPADSATIGIVDRIFTRIGAQEDLATGQSTFMVEMVETANILNNATPKSLIILDEVGRGTSTYDGLSIAWAVVEFIHNNPGLRSKTLFATHYHELIKVADILPRVRNFNIAVTESKGTVVFLRKVVPGGADKSYGIHVAQLAGLPSSVLHRATEVLGGLESHQLHNRQEGDIHSGLPVQQLPLFNTHAELVKEIKQADVDSMSPLEAITKLYELKKKAEEQDNI